MKITSYEVTGLYVITVLRVIISNLGRNHTVASTKLHSTAHTTPHTAARHPTPRHPTVQHRRAKLFQMRSEINNIDFTEHATQLYSIHATFPIYFLFPNRLFGNHQLLFGSTDVLVSLFVVYGPLMDDGEGLFDPVTALLI